MPATDPSNPDPELRGTLHVLLAFDWGDEIDLEQAEKIWPSRSLELARRSRTPASIAFQPPPRQFSAGVVSLELPNLGVVPCAAELTAFDFGAVSVSLAIPFALPAEQLLTVAAALANPQPITLAVREIVQPMFERLKPAIRQPAWDALSEEYFVFQFSPDGDRFDPERMLENRSAWLAQLLRLEAATLSADEVRESLRTRISYTTNDLLILEWSAALLIDEDCDETLQTIEFANVQLLEFRHIDADLDRRIAAAYRTINPLVRSRIPVWRTFQQPLRSLGQLRIDVRDLVERTENTLKLVGDQYLARVYQMLSGRFHLDRWEESIERSLRVVESVYQVIADQAASARTELLEWIVIVLIAFEVVMAFFRH